MTRKLPTHNTSNRQYASQHFLQASRNPIVAYYVFELFRPMGIEGGSTIFCVRMHRKKASWALQRASPPPPRAPSAPSALPRLPSPSSARRPPPPLNPFCRRQNPFSCGDAKGVRGHTAKAKAKKGEERGAIAGGPTDREGEYAHFISFTTYLSPKNGKDPLRPHREGPGVSGSPWAGGSGAPPGGPGPRPVESQGGRRERGTLAK